MNPKNEYAFLVSYASHTAQTMTPEADVIIVAPDVETASAIWKAKHQWQPILTITLLNKNPVIQCAGTATSPCACEQRIEALREALGCAVFTTKVNAEGGVDVRMDF